MGNKKITNLIEKNNSKNKIKFFKKIIIIFIFFILSNFINNIYADNVELNNGNKKNNSIEKNNIEKEKKEKLNLKIFKNIKKNISIGEKIKIDFSKIANKLNKDGKKYTFKWKISGKNDIIGPILEISFENFGQKTISLEIFNKEKNTIVFDKKNKEINFFVYEKFIGFIFSKEIKNNKIERFIKSYKNNGTFIYNIGHYSLDDIALNNILIKLEELEKLPGKGADFIGLWGGKDFISSIFSKIELDKKIKNNDSEYSFFAISSFNIRILDNYLNNFIANKNWLKTVVIGNEKISDYLDKELEIDKLKKYLIKNGYEKNFQDVRLIDNKINRYLFISNFINNLSGQGFDTLSIYIFILFPFLLTFIGFIKHFIGFSTLGIVIPSILIIIFFKFGILATSIFFFTFVFFNIILSKIFSKYILLYTPKTSMILIINIIIFMLILNILFDYNLVNLNMNNIFYLLLFIVISERIISIVLSKEFGEYKSGILNTYFVALLIFLLFSISDLKIFLLAFPEIILILIPLNFLIGKFTGLRVTEYFRFKEVIKNMEE